MGCGSSLPDQDPPQSTGMPGRGPREPLSQTWRDRLLRIADMDLWQGQRREDRPAWKTYLQQAQDALQVPRKQLPQDVVDKLLAGDLGKIEQGQIPSTQARIVIFVSSTFTDTKAERNLLMRDVYPYLRSLCRTLGMDFGTVDMRWGVREQATMEHGTVNMCLKEVQRCHEESAGPAFLAIVGHKYGYRPQPAIIPADEYQTLLQYLQAQGEDVKLLRENYQLDENAISLEYVLRPRHEGDDQWWTHSATMTSQLRRAASACLSAEHSEVYHISVTELEIKEGLFNNPNKNTQEERHKHRHMVDLTDGEIDEDAQQRLDDLYNNKVSTLLADVREVMLDFSYPDDDNCVEYLQKLCDDLCLHYTTSIITTYKNCLHYESDPVFLEVVQHRSFAIEKGSLFVGREELLQKIMDYVSRDKVEGNQVLAVYGVSGCGKTALMAVAAQQSKQRFPTCVVVLRFLGTTSASGSARTALSSICLQITRAYGKVQSAVPSSYSDLIECFQSCLQFSTPDKPLIIFLDSLDQLSNEDFGRNLKWLSLRTPLPRNTHIIVSTLPVTCLDILQGHLPSNMILQVTPFQVSDGPIVLEKMLTAKKRTITDEQRKIILEAFKHCPLPLFLRLSADVAIQWHSYDKLGSDAVAKDIPGLINTLFSRLENHFGRIFVHHALAYITAAKDGLSVAELEDILSCDDEVLDEIFNFWVPPFRRIPQLLWVRIRNDLGSYMVERGTDGVNAYNWYHRQFWETAEKRYLDASFKTAAHEAIAEYFQGKYSKGKKYTSKSGKTTIEDRQIPEQPLTLAGNRHTGRKLNLRQLSELPYHLIQLQDWYTLEQAVVNLPFLEAKFETGKGHDCLSELRMASNIADTELLKAAMKFISSNLPHLLREPQAIYQLAQQQVKGNPLRIMFEAFEKSLLPMDLLVTQNEDTIEDPCQMTFRGHTSGVRMVRTSLSGQLIASTAEDKTLRLWDPISGVEVMTVSGLPGPTYPGLADPYHGERPCIFTADDRHVVMGSEDGTLQVFDVHGAEKHNCKEHTAGITGLAVSPDGNWVVSCGKDGVAVIWNNTDFSVNKKVQLGQSALCCCYAPDGSAVAISHHGSLAFSLLTAATWHVKLSVGARTSLDICLTYSPDSKVIATAGDNSAVSLFDACDGTYMTSLVGHRGWIWGLEFTSDGKYLLSCSSDRTLKVWNMESKSAVATLGGHLHRVSWAAVGRGPISERFVTCSLDCSLKLWDLGAVLCGRVPPVGQLHYTILTSSADNKYLATSQGWSTTTTIEDVSSTRTLPLSTQHKGFLLDVHFSHDSRYVVSLDTGHTGAYQADTAKNASVMVLNLSTGSVSQLDIFSPCAVALSSTCIYTGTVNGKVVEFRFESVKEVTSWQSDETEVTQMSASNNHLACAHNSLVKIFNIDDKSCSKTLQMDSSVSKMVYIPDNSQLVIGTKTGNIGIYDATGNYDVTQTLVGHTGNIRDLVYNREGTYLASVAVDMSVRIWNVGHGYILKAVHYGPVDKITFISDNMLVGGESTGKRKYIKFDRK